MRQVIKYNFLVSETNGEKLFIGKTISYSDEALEIAKAEAYNGEYTIEEVPDAEPTAEERIAELEAQNAELQANLEMQAEVLDYLLMA